MLVNIAFDTRGFHVQAHMYNHRHCSLVNSAGAMKNSIAVAAAPIVSRAILLDFPRALGIPWLLGENFLLYEWAADCAADGVYEAFTCAGPIPFSRAVDTPVNPIVVK
jgi:hypothetical protein